MSGTQRDGQGYIREALGKLQGSLEGLEKSLIAQNAMTDRLAATQAVISERLETRIATEVRTNRDERRDFERDIGGKLQTFTEELGDKIDSLEKRSAATETTLKKIIAYATIAGGMITFIWMLLGPVIQEALKALFSATTGTKH